MSFKGVSEGEVKKTFNSMKKIVFFCSKWLIIGGALLYVLLTMVNK